ncbi:MAG: XRE family transcriptional regulator [Chloroflexi bacterium CFX4]|nr:XRE family transcriptional regulator [Chloroflexi bacterium CFX4]MDL1921970.1 helix-turn-helix transcriptional regulator [Chloroflexi bacterium CFX3]
MRGDRIRDRRIQLGLSQEDLAEMIKADQKRISKYENAQSGVTSDTLTALARALKTSADYLLGLTDDPEPPDDELKIEEHQALNAWRRGDKIEAIRIISSS